ncbi:hypothetical protein [Actibacterium ureilyticum]|uniref:hypothetical protein n=1 Tax=Actibacterium ureilyticum TaxID=1590614 RepID=UPI000BAAF460|nr:hypothetical protein [Actibacterium ureilyticum]
MFGFGKVFAGLVAGMALAGAVQAATVSEADIAGGEFSSNFMTPTVIDSGVSTVTGTGASGAFDLFAFSGLDTGAQTLSFNFAAPAGIGYSYSAGGSILYSLTPFDYAWDGLTAGTFHLGYGAETASVDLSLPDSFVGDLYLGLYFTYGSDISYGIGLPASVSSGTNPPSPVPLPAGGLLLGSVLAAAGLFAARRKR